MSQLSLLVPQKSHPLRVAFLWSSDRRDSTACAVSDGVSDAAVRRRIAGGLRRETDCAARSASRRVEPAGRSPTTGTTWPRASLGLRRLFVAQISHRCASPFRKQFRLAHLLSCERAHNGSLSPTTFFGLIRYQHPFFCSGSRRKLFAVP